jgi:hypothetical protein
MSSESLPRQVSTDSHSISRKRPSRVVGQLATNAAFIVPDQIRKKFIDGWNTHIPLTFLTDKACSSKNISTSLNSMQDYITIDDTSGRFMSTAKPLPSDGELDLSFDEWHQAWQRLLDLIARYAPQEHQFWLIHYEFILNKENRAELWPLYLSYDTEIRKRSTFDSLDPSQFHIGIWNDLEVRHISNKVLENVQKDMNLRVYQSASTSNPRSQQNQYRPAQNLSARSSDFRNRHNHSKGGKCIFCGDVSGTHLSRDYLHQRLPMPPTKTPTKQQ